MCPAAVDIATVAPSCNQSIVLLVVAAVAVVDMRCPYSHSEGGMVEILKQG